MLNRTKTISLRRFLRVRNGPEDKRSYHIQRLFNIQRRFISSFSKGRECHTSPQRPRFSTFMQALTIIISLFVMIAATISMTMPAHATEQWVPSATDQKAGDILPAELHTRFGDMQMLGLSLTSSLAILCLMLAGAFRMFGMHGQADVWTQDILKGLLQVIGAPILVGLLITFSQIISSFTSTL
ncbi:hypothetical protein [Caldalkalibacillus salinus]|uniref:hypothetical protein n=1 Tax=Caldalkalibacillus salinus TaxID=2803787 RepID=UPI001924A56E|nr:hypothetical protein [Caldalkalibacillus salinus]